MVENDENFETVITIGGSEVLGRTHNMPHIDEALPLLMLEIEGSSDFVKKYCPKNIIEIGIGGGAFDEHHIDGKERKEKGQCSSMLVAKALGIAENPKWKKMLYFVNRNDTRGSSNPRDIATVLKYLHRQQPDMQEENMNWALFGLWVKFHDVENTDYTVDRIYKVACANSWMRRHLDQEVWLKIGENALVQHQKCFELAKDEYQEKMAKKAVLKRLVPVNQHLVLVLGIETDNYQMGAFLRSKAVNASVAIIKNSRGQIMVAVNKKTGLKLTEVAAIIRLEEQKMKKQIICTDWNGLRSEGTVVGAEEWYYDFGLQALINGGFSYPNALPTRLPLSEIFFITCTGLDNQIFYHKNAAICRNGICRGNNCSWHSYGLFRCRAIRRDQRYKKIAA